MTTIAEEGNRRHGEMSYAEVEQCVMDIKAWFIRMDRGGGKGSGASNVDIERLQKTIDCVIPRTLECLLREDNGFIYIFEKKVMSCADIASAITSIEKSFGWKRGMIPFCGDESEALVVDSRNNVYEWDADDGVGSEIASSLIDYLETYRNGLLAGNFEYISGVGAVEKRATSSRK